MAAVTTLDRTDTSTAVSESTLVAVDIDLAAAATAKGSALAAADTIEAITFDGPCVVEFAGMYCKTTPSGGTGTVLDLGVTGGDVDYFVDGFVFDSATAGDYSTATGNCGYVLGSSDSVDILIQAATTVSTAGVVTVWAVVRPINLPDARRSAGEVVRDQLA